MGYRSNDDIMAEWRKIVARVEEVAARCQAAPESAFEYGIKPERQTGDLMQSFGGERIQAPINEKAMWLRAAAKSMIDGERWEWDVMEAVGGHAALSLRSYRDPANAFTSSSSAP